MPRLSLHVIARAGLLSAGILCALVRPAFAADGSRYVVIVQGASGEEQYALQHRKWVDTLTTVLVDRFHIDRSHISVLAEQPKANELRGTAESVRTVFERLAGEAKADDLVFVMLIGHGSGNAAAAKFNLVGPDLTVAEWAELLKPVAARIALVDSTSSSFPFLAGLSAPNRVIITATNSYAQVYHTVFADAFIRALTAAEADADKNGRLSLLEVFNHASRLVDQHYEQDGHLSTEKAVLDDNGDGQGRDASTKGDDGVVAELTYLDVVAVPTVSDPALQQLLTRQQELTEQIDALRRRRPGMTEEDFDREFERLIIDLALVSRDVRRRSGGKG